MHGDEVKMGETVLSFHIHSGTDTCDGCEPGQVMAHLSKHRREEKTGEQLSSAQLLLETRPVDSGSSLNSVARPLQAPRPPKKTRRPCGKRS